ncbi:MAG: hypothetical protein PHU99_10145 [Candidatus Cloacimonetes bacterium]|nr:hypothetical protein [Candidatus Cloacimonadota bacterium]MDD3578575.1 hypothetical protein [Candidatus Cloacimonadota bacterium]
MRNTLIIMLLVSMLLLSACAGSEQFKEGGKRANFFHGIWHGWIPPLSLVLSIFGDGIRMYEPNNTGWTYDLGFYIAILGGFGGFALTRKKKKDD